ncbi:O-antigen ligase family protein [Candidatus Peregrinibacteria bacterium]|nr:O-antigen ligase family protein [Candidatus Peregrinibacteria bacterium]
MKFLLGIIFFFSVIAFDKTSQMGFTLPKLVLLNVFLLGSFLYILFKKRKCQRQCQMKWHAHFKIPCIALAYFGILSLYVIFSLSPFVSFYGAYPELQGFSTQILYFAAFILTLSGFFDFFSSLVAANSVVIGYGLLQIFGLDPLKQSFFTEAFLGRTFSAIGNPNFLASYIVLTLPFLIGVWLREKKTEETEKLLKNIFFFLFVLANIVILVSTASKGGILAFGIIVLISVFTERNIFKNLLRKNMKHKMLSIMGFVALIAFLTLFMFSTFQKRHVLDFEAGRSVNARRVIWTDTWKLIQSRPQGYGLETLFLFYPRALSSELFEYEKLTANIDRAHNFILDLWIATGPLAPILMIIFLAMITKKSWKERETRFISLGLIGYYITLLFSFETVTTGFMFWLIAGRLLNYDVKFFADKSLNLQSKGYFLEIPFIKNTFEKFEIIYSQKQNIKKSSMRNAMRSMSQNVIRSIMCQIIFVGLIFALTWTLQLNIRHFIADRNYAKAEKFLAEKRVDNTLLKTLELYQKAVKIYPYDQAYLLKSTEVALFILEKMKKESARSEIEKNFITLEKLTRGYDASTHLLKAWYFALNGQKEDARKEIEEGTKLSPRHVNTYKMSTHVYRLLGEREKEQTAYKSLFSLLPFYLNNPASDASRIFWKENAWLKSLPYDTLNNNNP